MGATTSALTAVETALTAAGIATIIKEFSTIAPPTDAAHAVLSCEARPLTREDVGNFMGEVIVTADWFYPGTAQDGQTEFLAAMDAWDTIITALAGMNLAVASIDPGTVEREPETADLAHWYTATATITLLRKEPSS